MWVGSVNETKRNKANMRTRIGTRQIDTTRDNILQVEELVGKCLSVEVEYYPEGNPAPREHANNDVGHDGSLDDGGIEVRTRTFKTESGRLESLLEQEYDGSVNVRCGLHVHVDCRHLDPNHDAYDAENRYSAAETYDRLTELHAFLQKLVPPSRLDNKYCEWVNNRIGSATFERPQNGLRYAAINWCAFEEHRTIEFRCQSGSTNILKIEMWALLAQYLVDFCSNRENKLPKKWFQFVNILPEPVRSWAILRREKFISKRGIVVDARVVSATVE